MVERKKQPKPSKTETVKQRAIYVYLPSLETAQRWKKTANKEGVSISKFVTEHVENSLRQENEHTPRVELLEKIKRLEDENKDFRKQNRMLDKAVDNLESELRTFRLQPFLEPHHEGVRKYEKDLVELLRHRDRIRNDEILNALDIDPGDSDVIKAINKQLEHLAAYGLIKAIPRGWKWKG
jgi:hypothetical protein